MRQTILLIGALGLSANAAVPGRSRGVMTVEFEGRRYSASAPDAPAGKPPFLILEEMHDQDGNFYFVSIQQNALHLAKTDDHLHSNALVYGRLGLHPAPAALVDSWVDGRGFVHTLDAFRSQLEFDLLLRSTKFDQADLEAELKLHYPGRTSDAGLEPVPISGIADRGTLLIPHSELALRQARLDSSREALASYRMALVSIPLSRPTPPNSFEDDWAAFSHKDRYAGLKDIGIPRLDWDHRNELERGRTWVSGFNLSEPERLVVEAVDPEALTPDMMLSLQVLQERAIAAAAASSDAAEALFNIRLPKLR